MYRSLFFLATAFMVVTGCGDGGGMATGVGGAGGTVPSGSGPLVDNLEWMPTDEGADIFGDPPPDSSCALEPVGDCPVPDGDCVTIEPGSDCVTSHIAECLDGFTVLSVYTRRPDNTPLCNWITLEQESLRPIRAGDEIEARVFHFALNAPSGGEARIAMAVGDDLAFERTVLIPQNFAFYNESWVSPRDYPEGTRVLLHVDNHGTNEYGLVEVNVCDERPDGSDLPCLQ